MEYESESVSIISNDEAFCKNCNLKIYAEQYDDSSDNNDLNYRIIKHIKSSEHFEFNEYINNIVAYINGRLPF